MKRHVLKCQEGPFRAIWQGQKTHESRINDRGYDVGDELELHEVSDSAPVVNFTTGRFIVAVVMYVSNEWNSFGAVNRGHVVMSLGMVGMLRLRAAAQPLDTLGR